MREARNLSDRPFPFPELPERITSFGRYWGLLLAVGLGFIVLGVVAFSWPIHSTIGLTVALGVLFIIGGLEHLIHSFQLRKETGRGWRFLQSIISLAAGFLVLRYPASGMLGVAMLMAFYFFVSAVSRAAFAFSIRPHRGWGWSLVSAISSFLIGVYIVATFPVSALWVPGFLLGIDFVVYGATLVGFSFDLRKMHKQGKEISDHYTETPKAA